MDEDGPPDPAQATTAAEYVAALARLRRWSGLTYRRLASASGGALPVSTVAGVLGRTTLPREDFVAAFTAACGLDEAETDRWIRARRNLAAGTGEQHPTGEQTITGQAGTGQADTGQADTVQTDTGQAGQAGTGRAGSGQAGVGGQAGSGEIGPDPETPVSPAPDPAEPAPPRRSLARRSLVRRWWPVIAVAAGLAVALLFAPTLIRGMGDVLEGRADANQSAAAQPPQDGWYRIVPLHVADRGLCVSEGRERSGKTDRPLAVQTSCAAEGPATYLKSLGPGVYEIQWHHPKQGVGCLSVDGAYLGDEALLAPSDCIAAAHQRFLLERDRNGLRLRPVHSGKCLGALYGEADIHPGAEIAQLACSGKRDQIFRFEPVERPSWAESG
ncbi:helix-turn-helix domain-containing protein [Nonomuraea sp. NPDC050540]|uniref:helix-turn-helix domain-containing protein n=1 Tax=Nonomuraea sp. NPDC050540 TaxID=3364367 RepID=UPI0037A9F408